MSHRYVKKRKLTFTYILQKDGKKKKITKSYKPDSSETLKQLDNQEGVVSSIVDSNDIESHSENAIHVIAENTNESSGFNDEPPINTQKSKLKHLWTFVCRKDISGEVHQKH